MQLADPALAPTATCNVMWSIARQARAVRDPSAPETGEQHPCKHGYATERAAQLLTVCQLALGSTPLQGPLDCTHGTGNPEPDAR